MFLIFINYTNNYLTFTINPTNMSKIYIYDFTPDILKKISDEQIQILIFDEYFNYPLPILPDCVEQLIFDTEGFRVPTKYSDSNIRYNYNFAYGKSRFNQPLNNLPRNLKYIIFPEDSEFSQSLENLPSSLEYLATGWTYNKPIPYLPNLIYLWLGRKYSLALPKLSSKLQYLILEESFTQYLNNLPQNLEYLDIGFNYNKPLDKLPQELKYLHLSVKKFSHHINNLPNGLKVLDFSVCEKHNCTFNFLPEQLESLHISSKTIVKLDYLPTGLKYLDIRINDFGNKNADTYLISNLPNTVEELLVYCNVNLDTLPNSIKSLYINDFCQQSLDFLPNGIEELTLFRQKNVNFANLPKTIKNLKLVHCTYTNVQDIKLLTNLQYLDFTDGKVKKINKLPDSIELLHIYNTKINRLPKNIKTVYTSNYKLRENHIKLNPDSQVKFIGIGHYNDSDYDD